VTKGAIRSAGDHLADRPMTTRQLWATRILFLVFAAMFVVKCFVAVLMGRRLEALIPLGGMVIVALGVATWPPRRRAQLLGRWRPGGRREGGGGVEGR